MSLATIRDHQHTAEELLFDKKHLTGTIVNKLISGDAKLPPAVCEVTRWQCSLEDRHHKLRLHHIPIYIVKMCLDCHMHTPRNIQY